MNWIHWVAIVLSGILSALGILVSVESARAETSRQRALWRLAIVALGVVTTIAIAKDQRISSQEAAAATGLAASQAVKPQTRILAQLNAKIEELRAENRSLLDDNDKMRLSIEYDSQRIAELANEQIRQNAIQVGQLYRPEISETTNGEGEIETSNDGKTSLTLIGFRYMSSLPLRFHDPIVIPPGRTELFPGKDIQQNISDAKSHGITEVPVALYFLDELRNRHRADFVYRIVALQNREELRITMMRIVSPKEWPKAAFDARSAN